MASATPAFLMAEKKDVGRNKESFQLILSFSTKPDVQIHEIKVKYPRNRSLKVYLMGLEIYTLHLHGEVDSEKASEKVNGKKLIITVPKLDPQSWMTRGRCSPSRSSSDSS